MPDLTIGRLGELTQEELDRLIAELLESEGVRVEVRKATTDSDDEIDIPVVLTSDGTELLEVRKSGRSPLSGLSLPRLATRARALQVSRAKIYVTGEIDADRMAAYKAILDELQQGTGVIADIVDGSGIVARLGNQPQLAKKWFPTQEEVEEAAQAKGFPKPLTLLLTHTPSAASARPEYVRLIWTALVVGILVWMPLDLTPTCARWISGIGLGIIVIGVISTQLLRPDHETRREIGDAVMDLVLPVKRPSSFGRQVLKSQRGKWGPAALDYAKRLPGLILYAGARTALLLFLITFCFIYLLVWSLDPGMCGQEGCREAAFLSVGPTADFGEFMHLTVQAAFFNVPSEIQPGTSLTRGLVDAEFVLSAVLLGSYAAFFGFQRLNRRET